MPYSLPITGFAAAATPIRHFRFQLMSAAEAVLYAAEAFIFATSIDFITPLRLTPAFFTMPLRRSSRHFRYCMLSRH